MRKLGFALIALFVIGLMVVPLIGCRTQYDATKLGVGAGATWQDGPKVGVDASAGKIDLEVKPLFPAAGDAAEGGAGEACPGGVCPVPAAGGSGERFCPN